MKKIHKIDVNGYFLEDVILEDNEITPSDCVDVEVPEGFYKPKFANGTWTEGLSQETITNILGLTLNDVKQEKINVLTTINNSNITFTSSALGTVHTYLADDSAMAKFNAEYTYINSSSYDNSPILWYTLEEGGVNHTKDQFNQVWLEGRNFVANNFAKWDELVKKVKAITTDNQTLDQAIVQVKSIVW